MVQQFPIEQKDSRINAIGEMAWGLTILTEFHFKHSNPALRDAEFADIPGTKKSRPEGRRLNIKPKLFRGATL